MQVTASMVMTPNVELAEPGMYHVFYRSRLIYKWTYRRTIAALVNVYTKT